MNAPWCCCALIFALNCATVCEAQGARDQEVARILGELEAATNQRNPARLLRRATDDIVMISKNGETLVGRYALASYLDRMIGARDALRELRTTVQLSAPPLALDDRTMLVYGTSNDNYVFSTGFKLAITTSWSATLVLEFEEWKIASIHFSFDIFDNPVLKNAQRLSYWATGVGLALGMFFGGAIRWLSRVLREKDKAASQ